MTNDDYNAIIDSTPNLKATFKLEIIPKRWQRFMRIGDTLQYVSHETFFHARLGGNYFFNNYSCLRFIGYLSDIRNA